MRYAWSQEGPGTLIRAATGKSWAPNRQIVPTSTAQEDDGTH